MKLILLRHGESTNTVNNNFDGWADSKLSSTGVQQALEVGKKMKDQGITFDLAFTSVLSRSIQTLHHILEEMDLLYIPVYKHWRLNARHCGKLQGLNKANITDKYGEDQVYKWRRSYSERPPANFSYNFDKRYKDIPDIVLPYGESLEDTFNRVIPYFQNQILPYTKEYDNILISAHTHSIRSLIKYIDGLSDQEIEKVDVPPCQPIIYEISTDLEYRRLDIF